MDDNSLAGRAPSGDNRAFDSLRGDLEPAVRRFVRRLVGSHPAEDDIVQDAFIALYVNLHRISPPDRLRPFLYRIVRNRCYDELRRQGRYQTVSLDAPSVPGQEVCLPRDTRPPPGEAVLGLFLMAEVRQAVDSLPEVQRQSLILFCDEDLSLAEIASVMGTDVNTVKSRVHHARKNLRRKLSPETLRALGQTTEEDNDGK